MTNTLPTDDATETLDTPQLDGPGLFADRIAAEFAYSLRHGAPLSLIVIEPSHLAETLTIADPLFRECIRKSDFVARIDRHRIAVLAPSTPEPMAKKIAERLRACARRSMRIGLVTQTPACSFDGPGAMLRAAELALD
jgi:GGDEF domain-containing protein